MALTCAAGGSRASEPDAGAFGHPHPTRVIAEDGKFLHEYVENSGVGVTPFLLAHRVAVSAGGFAGTLVR